MVEIIIGVLLVLLLLIGTYAFYVHTKLTTLQTGIVSHDTRVINSELVIDKQIKLEREFETTHVKQANSVDLFNELHDQLHERGSS